LSELVIGTVDFWFWPGLSGLESALKDVEVRLGGEVRLGERPCGWICADGAQEFSGVREIRRETS
jgi:hypothetical protein